MTSQVVIRGALLHDGSGRAGRAADVLVRDGRIAAVESMAGSAVSGAEVVDAAGLVLAPGFIDIHNHGDLAVVSDPGCVSALGQGITTQLMGLCGYSAGPFGEASALSESIEEPIGGFPAAELTWRSIGGYRAALAAAGPGTNVATLVGHNTIRRTVIGSEARPATSAELDRMAAQVRESITEGAIGFSSGLTYAPGMYGDADELTTLVSAATEAGGVYHTHMRYGALGVLGSIDDAVASAEPSGARLNISHLYPSPDDPPDQADRIVDRLELARARGIDVTFDMTLFRRGCGPWIQALPPWALDGGIDALRARLDDPADRGRIRAEIAAAQPVAARTWEDSYVVHVTQAGAERFVGRNLAEIARERGTDPLDAGLDLLLVDPQAWVGTTSKRQDDLDRLLRHPLCIPITDGLCSHPTRHRGVGLMQTTFGAFGLLLGNYIRERGVLPLEEAIHRLTGLAAQRLGLHDRGLVAPGFAADLVLLDPERVANRSTLAEPWLPPAGIERVMVNGRWAWGYGSPTGARAGAVI